jgi:very-short-patch-repair endonuclease
MDDRLTKLARELRENSTNAERLFWSRVRGRRLEGFKFKRQHPVGRYIVDFICIDAKMIVELDGGQHASSEADEERDLKLAKLGFRVRRYWNNDVLRNIDGVLANVLTEVRKHNR